MRGPDAARSAGLLGAYVARDSPVHRVPAGAKLSVLALAGLGGLVAASWCTVAVLGVLLGAAWAAARVGVRPLLAQLRPLRVVVPVAFALQCWALGLAAAALVASRLVLLVALASLVVLTTPASAVLAAVERAAHPLRVVGVRPERVALVLSLTLRSIPVVSDLAGRARDAARARGRERDPRAYAVPLVVGALRRSDQLGEALLARGLDDDGL